MSELNKLREFAVQVNDGSGCIFQPMSDTESYILTAKHVIEGKDTQTITRKLLIDNKLIIIEIPPDKIKGVYPHPVDDIDAAIIVVEKIQNLQPLLRTEITDVRQGWYLSGFPNCRSDQEDNLVNFKIEIYNEGEFGYIEAELNNRQTYGEVVGMSGGGIIKEDGGAYVLTGIQKQMANKEEHEILGRVRFMPLSFFDEIVAKYNLAILYPSYIRCFSSLLENIFPLKNYVYNKDTIRNTLKVIAKKISAITSPKDILDVQGDNILINGQAKFEKYKELLWQTYLELLVINQVHSLNDLSKEETENLKKKQKFLFGKSTEWTELAEDILKSNISDVEKGGKIIINVDGDSEPNLVELPKGMLLNITNVPSSEMRIHKSVTSPYDDLSFIHIYKFQKHIIENQDKFSADNIETILKKIQNETANII